ncbi:hypothetical protein SDC9_53212 [bioreactor metagenome]|uniref:Uncharacterized protein n=1 Tax=bioreactor metagenome TaxID=1076179 RepID=A0A644WT63_9ZZZZ
MILITVENTDKHIFFIGTPADIGQILIFRFAGFHEDRFSAGNIINAQCHLMTRHSCHRIFCVFNFSNPRIYIHQGIIGHHGFIHAVKCHFISGRRPENSFLNTKFIAMHSLSAHHTFILFTCDSLFSSIDRNIQIVFQRIGRHVFCRAEVKIFSILVPRIFHFRFFCNHIHFHPFVFINNADF